jgi:1-acyl-sn-glycerol-3-phosphate acyltransferase
MTDAAVPSPETRLLALVAAVAAELHPGRKAAAPGLDSHLDRDLGFDSLGRVELLARIERDFDLALPESAFATAETPRDLLRALAAAAPPGRIAAPEAAPAVGLEGTDLPIAATTLVEVLDWHGRRTPDRVWATFFEDAGNGPRLTYGALLAAAERLGAGLQALDVAAGDRVALMLPTGPEYFEAFFGILLAGAVPVPLYPPPRPSQIAEHLERQAAILANCGASLLLTTDEILPAAGLLDARALTSRTVRERGAAPLVRPLRKAEDLAFLQYTSGSTGQPKGVALSHGNLLANVRAMGEALEAGPGDVFVSWLPLYHDMGLIGAALGTLYFAVPLVLMSPLAFLARPQRWLEAISRHRGTLSAAPNFAYELAARRVDDDELARLDLSRWRAALNGAEAVSPATLEDFAARFAPAGFRREALMPVYGLAECSVGLAFPPLGRGPRVETIDRAALQKSGKAVPASEGTLFQVACGFPLPGHAIRIADKAGRELPDRREGRIQFRGPSATSGYFRNPEATARLFDGPWLDGGDLGYLADGELFVTGRVKDLIIRAGRNIYPAEIEEAVGALEGVRRGNVAVFAGRDERAGTERLVVLAETRVRADAAREALRRRIAEVAGGLAGTPPDEVVLAPPGAVLKTSSGKVRRGATRRLFESGRLGRSRPAVRLQVARLALAALGPRLRRLVRDGAERLYAVHVLALTVLAVPFLYVGALAGSWATVRLAVRSLLALAGIRLTVAGRENLPPGGAVLVANHASYLDGFVLAAALPETLVFVAKAELGTSGFLRRPLERLGVRFVERLDRARSVEDAEGLAAIAASGRKLAVFPEGTFTRVAGLLPFRMGAFLAAVSAGAPVVPVAIRGTRTILRGESRFPRRGGIVVTVAAPLRAGKPDWNAALELRDEARARILAHCGEPDLGGRAAPFEDLLTD